MFEKLWYLNLEDSKMVYKNLLQFFFFGLIIHAYGIILFLDAYLNFFLLEFLWILPQLQIIVLLFLSIFVLIKYIFRHVKIANSLKLGIGELFGKYSLLIIVVFVHLFGLAIGSFILSLITFNTMR